MPFTKGNKLSTGRPPGSPNKRTQEVEEIAARIGVDPFEILLLFAKGDWKSLGYDNEVYHSENAEGETKLGYVITPELRAQCARDACQYMRPKKKSIEHVRQNVLNGMNPEQKLEAMRQAVAMLEHEVDDKRNIHDSTIDR